MFTRRATDGGALGGVLRSSHVATVTVRCPVLGRNVSADLEWDDWTSRFVDVARCSVFGPCARTTCSLRCIPGCARPVRR